MARSGKKTVDNLIGRIRIVMEQNQIPDFALPRDFHAFKPARMSPAVPFRSQLFGGILCVVNQDVRPMCQLSQIFVEFSDTWFVVCCIHNRSTRSLEPVAKTALRMVQPPGNNLRSPNFPFLPGGYFVKRPTSCHRAYVHWKIRARQLSFEHFSKAVRAQIFRLKAVEVKFVLRFKKRSEEGKALNVVPVVVGHEDVRMDTALPMRLRPEIPQHPHTGAAIEDKPRSFRRRQLQAGRVSAIAPGIALKRRRRAAYSPENQLGCVVRHRWAKLPARRPRPLRVRKP